MYTAAELCPETTYRGGTGLGEDGIDVTYDLRRAWNAYCEHWRITMIRMLQCIRPQRCTLLEMKLTRAAVPPYGG